MRDESKVTNVVWSSQLEFDASDSAERPLRGQNETGDLAP